jgi:hypothetical protein
MIDDVDIDRSMAINGSTLIHRLIDWFIGATTLKSMTQSMTQ